MKTLFILTASVACLGLSCVMALLGVSIFGAHAPAFAGPSLFLSVPCMAVAAIGLGLLVLGVASAVRELIGGAS